MSRERTDAIEREASARHTSSRPASRSGGALSAHAGLLLSLHRSFGNRAVEGLVQRMKEQNKKTVIDTLTALNQYLKQLNLSFRIGLDDFED